VFGASRRRRTSRRRRIKVQNAGDDGIPTEKLLHEIRTIGYGETLIKRAKSRGTSEEKSDNLRAVEVFPSCL
jgi:hypothetical protein